MVENKSVLQQRQQRKCRAAAAALQAVAAAAAAAGEISLFALMATLKTTAKFLNTFIRSHKNKARAGESKANPCACASLCTRARVCVYIN